MSLIKHFHLVGLEIVASGEQALRVTCSIFVTCYLHICSSQIRVRVSIGACTIGDFQIETVAKRRPITAVSINGTPVYFDKNLERSQAIFVFKGEDKAVSWLWVGAAGI